MYKMSKCHILKIWLPLFVGVLVSAQLVNAKVKVVSTTCQYQDESGSLDWMTCPLKVGQRQTPASYRQFEDDLNNSPSEQKFCCGKIDQRFCCSLDEKLRELPDFDPADSDDDDVGDVAVKEVDVEVVGWFDGFGFWSWLIVSSMSILLFGLIIYMASCVFVEIIDMIMYVVCCCFCRGYRARDGYEQHGESGRGKKKKKGKEYRPAQVEQPPQSRQLVNPSFVTTGSYQSAVPVHSYGGTDNLYQNVTPPPAYKA